MLDAQVQIIGRQRIQIRVAETRLVAVDFKTRRQLFKGRAHHAAGEGGADDGIVAELVAKMQCWQPVILVILVLLGGNHFIGGTETVRFEISALIAHTREYTQLLDINGAHQIGRLPVFADFIILDGGGDDIKLTGTGGQGAGLVRIHTTAEVTQGIVHIGAEIREHRIGLVDPDIHVTVFFPLADLGAELDGCRVIVPVKLAGEIQRQVTLLVRGLAFGFFHFIQLVVGIVIETGGIKRRRFTDSSETPVRKFCGKDRAVRMSGFILLGGAVAHPKIGDPVPGIVLATQHHGVDFLGFFPVLQFLFHFYQTGLARLLGTVEGENIGLTHFIVTETAVQDAQVQAGIVAEQVIHVQRHPESLAGDGVVTLFQFLQRIAAIEIPGAAGLHIIGAEIPLAPAYRPGNAEILFPIPHGELVAGRHRQLRTGLFRVVVITAGTTERVEKAGAVEGRQGIHFHGPAQGIAVHVRGQGLDHGERLQQVSGNHIQRHCPATGFRRGNLNTIDLHRVEIRRHATDTNETPLPLVTFDGHTRQTLQGFRYVGVREVTDIIRLRGALNIVSRPLPG